MGLRWGDRAGSLHPTRRHCEFNRAVSVAIARRLLWRMLGAEHPKAAFAAESQALWYVGGAADAAEGVKSFLEKRAPRFGMKVSTDLPDWI